ncbi:MAG TPA: Uma2 family endonuclease [Gemmatimonadaceae bacterium]|nr:Uma2 family endonuclease [Gemmatimonadaceae bacterium]
MTIHPSPGTRMTADDLIKLPDGEKFYELVRGVLRVSEPAGGRHGFVAGRIFARLSTYVEEHDLGIAFPDNTGFFIARDPDTVRAPDASFVSKARLSAEEIGAEFIDLAPDLAVEVVSPGDRVSEINEKVADYWRVGVRAVWIVDPATRTITVQAPDGSARVLREGDVLDGGGVVPGFRWEVAAVFGRVPRP